MKVRVKAPDNASAASLRQGLASLFGADCVAVDESHTVVTLRTSSDAVETVTGALNTIEHWLGINDILSTEVVLDDHMYLVARHGRTVHAPQLEPAGAQNGLPRRFRVLVVDDDPGVRMLCAATLSHAGVEVVEAEHGGHGLERALADRPDLVLLDVNMPVLDGFALAARLREDHRTRDVPFVFLTGELEPESQAKAYALGAAGFVSKPFDPRAVAALVISLLARTQTSTEPLIA